MKRSSRKTAFPSSMAVVCVLVIVGLAGPAPAGSAAAADGNRGGGRTVLNAADFRSPDSMTGGIQEAVANGSRVVHTFSVIHANGVRAGSRQSNLGVENLKIDGNRANVGYHTWQVAGITLIKTSHSTIRNVVLENSPAEGISDQGVGDTWNVISGNTITNNGGHGIEAHDIDLITISDNIIGGNSQGSPGDCCGISLENVEDPMVFGNRVSGNQGRGISCVASPALLSGNLVTGNSGSGIDCLGCDPEISNCTVADNIAGSGAGISCTSASPKITDCIIWGNEGLQVAADGESQPLLSHCNVQGGYAGRGNMDDDPLFVSGPAGEYSLRQTACGESENSPCLDAGSALASSICILAGWETYCLDQFTTGTCALGDLGQADLGYHARLEENGTLSAGLICLPASGTLPFLGSLTIVVGNTTEGPRTAHGRVDLSLAGGIQLAGVASGNLAVPAGAGQSADTVWTVALPSSPYYVGDNRFELICRDVTAAPFNQPPYPPSGSTDTSVCIVTGTAP